MQKQLIGNPFVFSLAEFSGALADLGVMLPLILALISLNGMDATAAFVGIGIAYILVAIVYRLPIPVQPLKSVSALALALGLAPVVIVTGAIWNAAAFLGMGLAGLDRWVQKAFPKPVVRGIQLGLAWLLFKSAWTLITKTPEAWQGGFALSDQTIPWLWTLVAGAVAFLLIFLLWRRDFAALGVVAFGVGISTFHIGLPPLALHFTLPKLLPLIPTWEQLWQGLIILAIPQIPLSLGNSIYATADAARAYFGEKASHVTERKLMLTMGATDAMTALIGGVPLCHGCGGLTAHYRLGARTGGAPLMLGGLFLLLGLFGGGVSMNIFRLIPFPVLGVLLAYVGFQHMLLAHDLRGWRAWLTALLVLTLAIWTGNLAIGFVSAAVFYHLWGWLSPRLSSHA
ncbi:MAG: putative sulfate/molybdate transporter [Anaerolineales bacterium]